MVINHNVTALNAWRQLTNNNNAQSKSLEKLSSGQRINRAGDDAAGLAISEKMRGQIRGLDQASRNSQDGISMIQTAEGALNETHSMLQRMRELTVQANNDTNTTDDRSSIQMEISQLNTEITSIANRTTFNTKNLLDGSLGVTVDTATVGGAGNTLAQLSAGITVSLTGVATGSSIAISVAAGAITATLGGVKQTINTVASAEAAGAVLNFDKIGLKIQMATSAGASISTIDTENFTAIGNSANFQIDANSNSYSTLSITVKDMSASAIGVAGGLTSVNQVNVATQAFSSNIAAIDQAIKDVSTQRAQLGAWQNRLEHTINNLGTSSENLTAAESRVRDVDMAKEMMEQTKDNILSQASTAMLAQANQQPQGVLQLLR